MVSPKVGYKARFRAGGDSTAFTGQACTLVSGKTYRINTSARRTLDPNVARTWKDNGVAVAAANIASEDLLFGMVTFAASYSVTGPVTLDGSYIALGAVAQVQKLEQEENCNPVDTSTIDSAGYRLRTPTLLDFKGTATLFEDGRTAQSAWASSKSFIDLIEGRTSFLYEFDPDGSGTYVQRAWVILENIKTSYDAPGVATGQISFDLNAKGNALALAGKAWGAP